MRPSLASKTRNRRTINIISGSSQGLPNFYAHMFVEDIHSGIVMRNLGFKNEVPKKIEIVGDANGIERATAVCASIAREGSYGSDNMARRAIESLALHLAWYGEALFEIVETAEQTPRLAVVFKNNLYRIPFAFIQRVPSAQLNETSGRRWVALPSSDAWLLTMPPKLGGAKNHRKLLRRLESISPGTPEFWSQDLQTGRASTEFDFGKYKRWEHLAVAKITNCWGWDVRGLPRDFETEFYHFNRGLRFRRARALLRQHIVSEINRLFTRLRIEAELKIEGYPSPSDVDALISLAVSGELSYSDAYGKSA